MRLSLSLRASGFLKRDHANEMTDTARLEAMETERAYVKKVMKRLGPFIAILYVFCLLDRGNVGNAALTLKPDLHFSDQVYGLGAGIFFIGYFLFEVPSNLFMERVGARWWISRIMVSWGIISAAMMFVQTPIHFYVLRFLLGVAEAGFFPGIILYFTYWIPATSRARAISVFLALTAYLGLFGGPLAGLLLAMDGIGGLKGWQWLFLLEGIPSVLLGILVLFVLPDKPDHADWLTQSEKDFIDGRLRAEAENTQTVQHLSLKVALTEPRILHMCLVFIISSTAGNAVGFFQPALVQAKSGGVWSPSFVSSILVIPGLVGAVAMVLASGHSDRTGQRRLHLLLGYTVAAMGYVACIFAPSGWSALAALSLFSLGERIGAGSYWALTTNLLGARAAAGGIAMINSIGNLGGFIGPTIMGRIMVSTHGNYTVGLCMSASLMIVAAILGGLLRKHPTHTT